MPYIKHGFTLVQLTDASPGAFGRVRNILSILTPFQPYFHFPLFPAKLARTGTILYRMQADFIWLSQSHFIADMVHKGIGDAQQTVCHLYPGPVVRTRHPRGPGEKTLEVHGPCRVWSKREDPLAAPEGP